MEKQSALSREKKETGHRPLCTLSLSLEAGGSARRSPQALSKGNHPLIAPTITGKGQQDGGNSFTHTSFDSFSINIDAWHKAFYS